MAASKNCITANQDRRSSLPAREKLLELGCEEKPNGVLGNKGIQFSKGQQVYTINEQGREYEFTLEITERERRSCQHPKKENNRCPFTERRTEELRRQINGLHRAFPICFSHTQFSYLLKFRALLYFHWLPGYLLMRAEGIWNKLN
ncbi:hypothetical protein Y1Q_0012495 [Alligator mississippiensis]|uniref:Uncharacterized protein n=1 Tax=Alligator mississippiensis TaxID=8496 RepID=A0A151M821_ALLMI|nr:hypothetical protein Y1Q_0012495 [Alligator mississippiensis]